MNLLPHIRQVIATFPEVRTYLTGRARWSLYKPAEYKTYDYMLSVITGLVNGVYSGNVGGQFIDTLANIISGQLTQAYQQAFEDEGFTDFALPDYLAASLEAMILNQYDYVDQFFRDIVDARIDGTSIDPLLARAGMWANRWNEAYNEAVRLITLQNGGRMMWQYGEAEHCETCRALNGIVAFASEWDTLGVRPQNAPNNLIECGGWNCQCALVPTEKRRSPGAYGRIEAAIMGI